MFKKTIIIITIFLLIILIYFLVFSGNCENDFKVYPEKGYCEFNLRSCEGVLGCKEYNNVQVPCESVSTLCGEKILCNCENINN